MRLFPLLLLPLVAAAEPTTYTLDGGELVVLVKPSETTLMRGSHHVLLTQSFNGSVKVDPQDPATCAIEVRFKVDSLQVDPGDARSRYGLDGETSDSNKETIKKNALSKGQLDVANHPEISFKSSSCSKHDGKVAVHGDLTIRGASHTLTVDVDLSVEDERFTAKGRFTANHEDFGFKPYSAVLGALKNHEELTFVVDVTGKAAE
ncbi:MAG: YceI family protein [Deltaproteobacteria bacterium]|nr:MAG: YceI family protein [Deltaproteobacteria bacterium]